MTKQTNSGLTKTYENNDIVKRRRKYIEKIGMTGHESKALPDSNEKFPDGGHFRIEIPTINSLDAVLSIIKKRKKLGIKVNRITETLGIFRHTKAEIIDMKQACDE